MTQALYRYPRMKASRVSWFPEIPEHWKARRLRTLSKMRVSNVDKHSREGEEPVRLCNYVDVYYHNSIHPQMTFLEATATEEEIQRFRLQRDDVLITKDSETWNDIGVPALVEDGAPDLLSGYHLALLRPDPQLMTGGYLFRALQSPGVAGQLHVSANGVTRYGLSHHGIKSTVVPLPSVSEQAAIARFLDCTDRRIQRYIRAKEKLIALLDEYNQTLIHQAVTGQIDVRTGRPYDEYKESGVEWLGRVPKRWSVLRLARTTLARCDGPFGSGLKSSHYTPDGIRVVRLQNIGHAVFKGADVAYIDPKHYATLGDHSVVPRDLLIAGLGDDRHPAGRACVAPEAIAPAMVKADCFRFRLDQTVAHPEYVALQLTATAAAATSTLSTGATRQRINLQSTSGRYIILPSMPEQLRIVEHTTQHASYVRAAKQLALKEIKLLEEYRSCLITDVVTGKLDVREAAVSLPDSDRPEASPGGNDLSTDIKALGLNEGTAPAS